jgi:hypothetical protein
MKSPAPIRIPFREQLLVLTATAIASAIAVCWSWRHAAFLLYGDAEAHIHIARRLFDSHRPGITQLGSVWLPLPHLLLVPFLLDANWWRSGFAPVFPSAACYLLACLGLYRLARKWLSSAASIVALTIFATNPNLLYMQTTAMTEPLFLCELIWSVLLLVEWYSNLDRNVSNGPGGWRLWAVIAVLAAAVYTRYDGWILAFLAWLAMAVCLYRRGRLLRAPFVAASIVLLLAPIGWMVYNAVVFADWLDFMRGPYSARAIELRTASSSVDPHPGWHNPWIALVYFAKAAEMDAAALGWGEILFLISAVGTAWAWLRYGRATPPTWSVASPPLTGKQIAWTLLLWLPLPFYTYSVSYGSVPIFLPVWKPFSWYNTRYGMELLPAFAFFAGFFLQLVMDRLQQDRLQQRRSSPTWRPAAALVLAVLAAQAVNAALMLRQGPLTYVEAVKNAASRSYYNVVIAEALARLHAEDPQGVVLMDTSTYPSLVPHAGLTYRQTINESDKEFYWAALGAPSAHASIILAFAGDEIDKAVHAHPKHLRMVQTFQPPGKAWDQLAATLYVTDTFPRTPAPQPSTAASTR